MTLQCVKLASLKSVSQNDLSCMFLVRVSHKRYSCARFGVQNLKKQQELPWWHSGKNQPANAGDTGSSPGPGGSHMPQSI